jgi:glycosyltransferase involved in cell wall biosynthesis
MNIPSILFYESTLASHRFNGFFIRKFRLWVFSLADLVVTAGTASTEAVLDMGISPEKIVTLFNPVDVQWFSDFASKNRVNASSGHRFLYVGQLIERKNVGALIDAFCAIRQPDDALTIVGDGPLSSTLAAQAKSLGLEGVIRFAGHCDQEQVALEYSQHDTFILPSTSDPFGDRETTT